VRLLCNTEHDLPHLSQGIEWIQLTGCFAATAAATTPLALLRIGGQISGARANAVVRRSRHDPQAMTAQPRWFENSSCASRNVHWFEKIYCEYGSKDVFALLCASLDSGTQKSDVVSNQRWDRSLCQDNRRSACVRG
jgi:hypothetical protein